MPMAINPAGGFGSSRGLKPRQIDPFTPAPQERKVTRIPMKTQCDKDPDSLACLEEKLSNLRSQTSNWNIGEQVKSLQTQIQKKRKI